VGSVRTRGIARLANSGTDGCGTEDEAYERDGMRGEENEDGTEAAQSGFPE
jgi:hypothetical protein